jgi:hypothetical protein
MDPNGMGILEFWLGVSAKKNKEGGKNGDGTKTKGRTMPKWVGG